MIVLGVPMFEKAWGMLIDGNMDVASHLFEKMVESGGYSVGSHELNNLGTPKPLP